MFRVGRVDYKVMGKPTRLKLFAINSRNIDIFNHLLHQKL
jgi:hypothetical protein